jgi:PHD/YefM family antitoxin component YafN of YafNO toxin-antitoxin module
VKTIELDDAPEALAEAARDAVNTPLIITNKGKPYAAFLSVQDADWESIRLATSPRFQAIIERSRERQRREGGISPEEMRRRLGVAPRPRRTAKRTRQHKGEV